MYWWMCPCESLCSDCHLQPSNHPKRFCQNAAPTCSSEVLRFVPFACVVSGERKQLHYSCFLQYMMCSFRQTKVKRLRYTGWNLLSLSLSFSLCKCTHTHTHTHRHARTHTTTHARVRTHTHTYTHKHTHARTHTNTHTQTHTLTHARTHARTHTHTQTHTRTHTSMKQVMVGMYKSIRRRGGRNAFLG